MEPVIKSIKTYAKRPRPTQAYPNIVCCRACLETEGKLYNMHEYNLAEAFTRISGFSVKADKFPQHLCAYCVALLRRCAKFRAKCARANLFLLSELMTRNLTIKYIRGIDRVSHRLVDIKATEVEITDDTSADLEALPQTIEDVIHDDGHFIENNEENLNKNEVKINGGLFVIKTEENDIPNSNNSNMEVACVNENEVKISGGLFVIKTEENDIPNSNNSNMEVACVNENEVKIRGGLFVIKTEENDIPNSSNSNMEVTCVNENEDKLNGGIFVIKTEENDIPNSSNSNMEVACVNENEVKINGDLFVIKNVDDILKPKKVTRTLKIRKPRKKKKKIEKAIDTNGEVNVKKRRKKKHRKKMAKDNYVLPVFDYATFERTYGVKIITLSKEEQLKEIENRRASDKYRNATYRCEPCGKVFTTESTYNNHREYHSVREGALECEICTLRLSAVRAMWRHRDAHSLKLVCWCGFISRTRPQAVKHHERHSGRTYVCQYCGKCFGVSGTYMSHLRMVHPDMNLVCNLCGEAFISTAGLCFHKSRVHAVKSQNELKCPTCSVVFVTPVALKKHTESGELEGRSPCTYCGDSFDGQAALESHMADSHPNCKECSQTFVDTASYKIHHRRKHLGKSYGVGENTRSRVRPVPRRCEECGAGFPNENHLRVHVRSRHPGLRLMLYPCDECPKIYDSNSALKKHRRTHTDEKPFQCDHCKIFTRAKSNLQRHIRVVHLGQREHIPCEVCDKTFATNWAKSMHINTVHGGMPWPRRTRKRPNKKATENRDSD